MSSNDTELWKISIPKKLRNKINYYIKKYGMSRDFFFDGGIDVLQKKYIVPIDFPDPKRLYHFSEEEEAELVIWQVKFDKYWASNYNKFMQEYGFNGRDVLAAALYESLN